MTQGTGELSEQRQKAAGIPRASVTHTWPEGASLRAISLPSKEDKRGKSIHKQFVMLFGGGAGPTYGLIIGCRGLVRFQVKYRKR